MKKKISLGIAAVIGLSLFLFTSYRLGVKEGQVNTCGPLIEKLEKELDTQKEIGYQGVIDNLELSGCKSIVIRAVNFNNEVKEVQFLGTDIIEGNKAVKIRIAGIVKNFEYHNFMKKVVRIECSDNFKW